MTGKRLQTFAIILILVLAVVVSLWLSFMAPGYNERELKIRSENAVIKKDLDEIEAVIGSMDIVDGKISDFNTEIEEKYSGRADGSESITALIEAIFRRAGLKSPGIAIGNTYPVGAAGIVAKSLYTAEFNILFEGTEETGASIIRDLENCKTADFEVTAFIYRAIEPDGEEEMEPSSEYVQRGEWRITAKIYFYG